MRIGSLFSGYGGADMAVTSLWPDATPAWFVEYDKAPSAVLAHHWPDVPNYGDVTTVDWSSVEPVDILTGGYPCQPFSHAGQRRGTDDERHLFPYVATAIGVLRPRVICLVATNADRVAGAASGSLRHRDEQNGEPEPQSGVARRDSTATDAESQPGEGGAAGPRPQLPGRADSSTPADAQHDGRDAAAVCGSPGPQQDQGRVQQPEGHAAGFGPYAAAIARWERALGRPAPAPTEPGKDGRPRLNPAFVEWMMGLPEGWVTDTPGVSRVAQLKMLGNGIVPAQMELALRLLLDMGAQPVGSDKTLPTPTASDARDGVHVRQMTVDAITRGSSRGASLNHIFENADVHAHHFGGDA